VPQAPAFLTETIWETGCSPLSAALKIMEFLSTTRAAGGLAIFRLLKTVPMRALAGIFVYWLMPETM